MPSKSSSLKIVYWDASAHACAVGYIATWGSMNASRYVEAAQFPNGRGIGAAPAGRSQAHCAVGGGGRGSTSRSKTRAYGPQAPPGAGACPWGWVEHLPSSIPEAPAAGCGADCAATLCRMACAVAGTSQHGGSGGVFASCEAAAAKQASRPPSPVCGFGQRTWPCSNCAAIKPLVSTARANAVCLKALCSSKRMVCSAVAVSRCAQLCCSSTLS